MSDILKALADASRACKRAHDTAMIAGRRDVADLALAAQHELSRAIVALVPKRAQAVVS